DDVHLQATLAALNDFLNGQFSPTIGASQYREVPLPTKPKL
ncbi:hypothetical protein Lpp126_11910, partial [Lacticaseibacillus paracasei subsp. paracasei Lpp126]